MSNIVMAEVKGIKDPKLAEICDAIVSSVKLGTEKAYASLEDPNRYKLPEDENSIEQIMLSYLKAMPKKKQDHCCEKAVEMSKKSIHARVAQYGELARRVAADDPTPIEHKLAEHCAACDISLSKQHLESLAGNAFDKAIKRTPQFTIPPIRDDFFPQSSSDAMQFRIHQVKCVDETGNNWLAELGSDEISVSGVVYDATGKKTELREHRLGNYDDGTTRNFSNPLEILPSALDLRAGGNQWPKEYTVILALIEKDSGGAYKILKKLWDKIDGKVIEMVSAATGLAVGTAIGTAAIPGLGSLIGMAAGYAIGISINWLIEAFQDDVFVPLTTTIKVPSINHLWPGNRSDSPNRQMVFKGHNAEYVLTYDWNRTFSNPPVKPRLLNGRITMTAVDDDWGRDPRKTEVHNINQRLRGLGDSHSLSVPHLGVGGEVRLEFNVKATIRDTSGTIKITGKARLFEGTSERTSDLDDEKNVNITIPAGTRKSVTFKLDNPEWGAGDWGRVSIDLKNDSA